MDLNNQPFRFSGATPNTFTGTVTVVSGTLDLMKNAGVIAIPGDLVIGDGAGADKVLVSAAGQIASGTTITINSNGVLDVAAANYVFTNTFKGTGLIWTGGKTNILAQGGVMTPGTNGVLIGTLTVATNLDFRGTYAFDYDRPGATAVPGTNSDLIATANLVFGAAGGTATVNATWRGTGNPGYGDYTLFAYTSTSNPIITTPWTVTVPEGLRGGQVWVDTTKKQVVLTVFGPPGGTVIMLR